MLVTDVVSVRCCLSRVNLAHGTTACVPSYSWLDPLDCKLVGLNPLSLLAASALPGVVVVMITPICSHNRQPTLPLAASEYCLDLALKLSRAWRSWVLLSSGNRLPDSLV
jgi:hypothetical protein